MNSQGWVNSHLGAARRDPSPRATRWLRFQTAADTVPCMMTVTAPAPGSYARRLARRSRWAAIKLAGGAAIAFYAAAWLAGRAHTTLAIAVAGVGVLLGLAARARWRSGAKAAVGGRVEAELADVIDACSWGWRANVILGAGGDADFVVVTRGGGLAVIECKAGGGQVRVEKGRLVTGKGRVVPGNPVEQAARQADRLAQLTGTMVHPIVCFPWMRNPPFEVAGTVVCGAAHLGRVLDGRGGYIEKASVPQLLNSIERVGARGGAR